MPVCWVLASHYCTNILVVCWSGLGDGPVVMLSLLEPCQRSQTSLTLETNVDIQSELGNYRCWISAGMVMLVRFCFRVMSVRCNLCHVAHCGILLRTYVSCFCTLQMTFMGFAGRWCNLGMPSSRYGGCIASTVLYIACYIQVLTRILRAQASFSHFTCLFLFSRENSHVVGRFYVTTLQSRSLLELSRGKTYTRVHGSTTFRLFFGGYKMAT